MHSRSAVAVLAERQESTRAQREPIAHSPRLHLKAADLAAQGTAAAAAQAVVASQTLTAAQVLPIRVRRVETETVAHLDTPVAVAAVPLLSALPLLPPRRARVVTE